MGSEVAHVCFVGIYGNVQNEVLKQALQDRGITVDEVGVSARRTNISVTGRELPIYAARPTLNYFGQFPSLLFPLFFTLVFLAHTAVTWAGLLAHYPSVRRTDVLIVPHLGATAVLSVKPVAVLTDTPVIYLCHDGVYFGLVEDRGLFPSESVAGYFVKRVSWVLQRVADRVIVFSDYEGEIFASTFGLPKEKYATVYVSVPESRFSDHIPTNRITEVDVLYWGNFIPNHGVQTMVEAAALSDHSFVFAGDGDHREQVEKRANQLDVDNIKFLGFVSDAKLHGLINEASVVFGPVGDQIQTSMAISTKVAEASLIGKPIILGDHPAPNEVFNHMKSAMLVDPANPDALSNMVDTVVSDTELQELLANGSKCVYRKYFSPEKSAERLLAAVPESGTEYVKSSG